MFTIALPKGRLVDKVCKLFDRQRAGLRGRAG